MDATRYTPQLLALCLSIMGLLTGCQRTPGPAGAGAPVTLTVSAASDLTVAFAEIGRQFEAETGTKIIFNFGSTGQLVQQIEQGAPVDVFAAANTSYVENLERKGLILADTKKVYARGRLVLWLRADSNLPIEHIEDLIRPDVQRIAIANPDFAPYGTAAREALQAAEIWSAIQPKLILGENVRQAFQYAQTGNVDAALVSLALVTPPSSGTLVAGDAGRWTIVPQDLYRPFNQALAVVKGTAHEREARAFAEFVANARGQAILRTYGFERPGP